MQRIGICMMVVSMLSVLLLAEASSAQRGVQWRGSGRGSGGQYGRLHDPATVETIGAEVVNVDRFRPMKGMGQGVHMAVKMATETVSVCLGPAWYLENQDVKLAPQETVEVTGSRIIFDNA